MAACTTTYFEAGRGWDARVAEHNAELLAQQALRRRGVRTPEFHFPRHFDNSRLVKAADPGARARDAHVLRGRRAALFAGHDLRPAALLRHRGRLPRGAGEADASTSCARTTASCAWPRPNSRSPAASTRWPASLGLAEPQPGQVVHPNARPDAPLPPGPGNASRPVEQLLALSFQLCIGACESPPRAVLWNQAEKAIRRGGEGFLF